MDSSKLARWAEKIIQGKYFLGDRSQGWDCVSLVLDFCETFNVPHVDEMEGIRESSYADLWNQDNERAREILEKFLLSLGDPVGHTYYVRGDLLVFKGRILGTFPAFDLGNGKMLMVFQDGPCVLPTEGMKPYLIAARRLVKE